MKENDKITVVLTKNVLVITFETLFDTLLQNWNIEEPNQNLFFTDKEQDVLSVRFQIAVIFILNRTKNGLISFSHYRQLFLCLSSAGFPELASFHFLVFPKSVCKTLFQHLLVITGNNK